MRPLQLRLAFAAPVALAVAGCASPAPAASAPTRTARVEEPRVSLCVDSLGDAARLLALQTGIAVSCERPRVPVVIALQDAPLGEALDELARQSGLAVTRGPNGIHIGARRPIVGEARPGADGAPRLDVVLDQSDVALALRTLARLPAARLDVSRCPALTRPGPLASCSLRGVPARQAILVLAKANDLTVRWLDAGRAELLPAVEQDTWSALDGHVVDGGRTIMTGSYVGHDEQVVSISRDGDLTDLTLLEGERADVLDDLRHARDGDPLVARVERYLGRWRLLSLDPDMGWTGPAGPRHPLRRRRVR